MLGSKKKLCPASWSGLRLKPALDKGLATLFLDFSLTKFCDNLRTTASKVNLWNLHKLTTVWKESPFYYFTYHLGFPRPLLQVLLFHLSQLARYGWTCACWDKIFNIYFTENIKSFLIYTLVFNSWAGFPDLRRSTLIFCYCWWVMIHKVTFTAIINIRLRCNKRYGRFRALKINMMLSMGWPWLVIPLLSTCLHSLPVPLTFSEL